jgi:putative oxidoreductase
MMVVRRLARPMLASIFVIGGLDAVRNPDSKAPAAGSLLGDSLPDLPAVSDVSDLVRLDGFVKVLAGLALGVGKFPRPAALVLAASLVPTTLAGHRFWDQPAGPQRVAQQLQFTKNTSILGGLLMAAVDTEARPSLRWRARRASHAWANTVDSSLHSLADSARARTT